MTTIREAIDNALRDNGIGPTPPADIHHWRCLYPERYGLCRCYESLLDDLVKAVKAVIR